MKILLISDTHGAFTMTQKVIEQEAADVILHMGDVGFDPYYLGQVYYVKGNHDEDLKEPKERLLTLKKKTIYMLHGDMIEKEVFENLKRKQQQYWLDINNCMEEFIEVLHDTGIRKRADIVCFGHTHQPVIREFDDMLVINPGSLALPFNGTHVSYAVLCITDTKIYAELKYHPYDEK